MKIRKFSIWTILKYAVLLFFVVIMVYPLIFAVLSSFKNNMQIFDNPFGAPESWAPTNYQLAWVQADFAVYFRNSLFLSVVSVLILCVLGTMAAYGLSRFRFKLNNLAYMVFSMGMMIPMHAALVPIAYAMGIFDLRNQYWALIAFYVAFQLPITIILLYGFMKGLPREVEEAAIVDGCSYFQVLIRVVVPISIPAIATSAIFNFLQIWNNLLFPLVLIQDQSKKPLSVGLLSFFGEQSVDYGGVMAGIIISILPPLIIYILLQEKVEKGLTAGAVKE